MKVRIYLTLTAINFVLDNGLEFFPDLTKYIDLDFYPFPYLRIGFSCETANEKDAAEYQKIIAQAPESVSGIIHVDSVIYWHESKECHIRAYEGYETPEMLASAVEQWVLAYGFQRSDL